MDIHGGKKLSDMGSMGIFLIVYWDDRPSHVLVSFFLSSWDIPWKIAGYLVFHEWQLATMVKHDAMYISHLWVG